MAPCLKNYTHDWSACPFAHKGEKATRRDPLKYSYMASNCPDHKKGACPRGDLCTFSHGVFESCLHPERYRTQMCNSGVACTRSVCFFAHSVEELRSPYCQNCPSQLDSATVTTLRALIGRSGKGGEPSPPMTPPPIQPQQPIGMHQQSQQQQVSNLLRAAASALPGFVGQGGFQSSNPASSSAAPQQANEILKQAYNLIAAIQMLGNNGDTNLSQQNVLNLLRSNSTPLPCTGSSLFGGVSSFGQQSNLSGPSSGSLHNDWNSLGICEGGFSMMLGSAQHQGQGHMVQKQDMGCPINQYPPSHNDYSLPAYSLPQHHFSYLAS